jgi:hypothetical protein
MSKIKEYLMDHPELTDLEIVQEALRAKKLILDIETKSNELIDKVGLYKSMEDLAIVALNPEKLSVTEKALVEVNANVASGFVISNEQEVLPRTYSKEAFQELNISRLIETVSDVKDIAFKTHTLTHILINNATITKTKLDTLNELLSAVKIDKKPLGFDIANFSLSNINKENVSSSIKRIEALNETVVTNLFDLLDKANKEFVIKGEGYSLESFNLVLTRLNINIGTRVSLENTEDNYDGLIIDVFPDKPLQIDKETKSEELTYDELISRLNDCLKVMTTITTTLLTACQICNDSTSAKDFFENAKQLLSNPSLGTDKKDLILKHVSLFLSTLTSLDKELSFINTCINEVLTLVNIYETTLKG